MGFVKGLAKAAAGAVTGVTVVTALPLFGAVGAITAGGLIVGSLLGAVAGVADEVLETKKDGAPAKRTQRVVKRRNKPK